VSALLAASSWSTPMPEVGPMRPYKAPARAQWRLANGMQAVLVTDRRLPLVTAKLAVRSGGAAFGPEDAGLSDALAELLTDGTDRLSSKAIADAADDYGGRLWARADADSVTLESYCLSEFSGKMFELMAAVARRPSFPQAEVALRKKNMAEELQVSRAESDFLAGVAFYRKLFGSHPYGITAATESSIARIGRARLLEAHKRLFTPRNALLIVVGDISLDQAKKMAERNFGGWKGGAAPAAASAVASGARRRRIYLVDRPGSVQVSLFLGNLAMREDHPDYFNFLVANQVLGGSFASRLVSDVRETRGYTYRISSRVESRLTAGIFRVRTPVRNEVVEAALDAILGHLDRIRSKQISSEELAKAKNYLAGSFVRGLETQDGVASALLHIKLHRLPEDFLDHYVEKVQAVETPAVLRAATTYIRPDELVIVAVGDAANIRDCLARFSSDPVVAVDQDGN